MSIATITSKGQTTIPKDIRDSLDMKPGDQITATFDERAAKLTGFVTA